MKLLILITAFLMLSNTSIKSQSIENSSKESIIERIVESIEDKVGIEGDASEILDDLEALYSNKLNLNTASQSDLEKLHILTSFQIDTLISYRIKVGQIFSIYELQMLPGFDNALVNDLENLTTCDSSNPTLFAKEYSKNELWLRYQKVIENSKGYIADEDGNSNYNGKNAKMYLQYRGEKNNKFAYGITAENDAGEPFFAESNKHGFDFYSAHFGYTGSGILQKVCIGDFQVKMGQGLIQWSGFGTQKSADATNILFTGQGIRPFTSTDENMFLRGAATTFKLKNFEITGFYSNHRIDANISEMDSTGETTQISSLQISGYHRTNSEIADEDAVRQQVGGGSIHYRKSKFKIGANSTFQKLNIPLLPDEALYNKYRFKGNFTYNSSIDYQWMLHRVNLFGETAISKSGGNATTFGVELSPANEIQTSVLYRHFSRNFEAPLGNAFSESSGNSNETGIYFGVTILPISRWKITAYYDLYESEWLKFSTNSPVNGSDFMAQLNFTPTRKLNLYLRYKSEKTSEKSSAIQPIKEDVEQISSKVRFNAIWEINPIFTMKLRAEWSKFSTADTSENGYLVAYDIAYKAINGKLSANTRIAAYNTHSYNTRIYIYENDIPRYFYIPAYSGRGVRGYLNIGYKLAENISVYFKLSRSFIGTGETFGSGYDEIDQSHKTEAKLLLRFRL